MTLEKSSDFPGCWRLEAGIRPDTTTILKIINSTIGESITELIRRAMVCYDMALETEFAGGKVWIVNEQMAHQILSDRTFKDSASYLSGVAVNVNSAHATLLEAVQTIKGYTHGETLDQAIHYYGDLIDVSIIGSQIIQVLPNEVHTVHLVE